MPIIQRAHTSDIGRDPSETPTPFIKGMRDAGSVDIDASSRKTTGKSSTLSATLAEVMQVVQILHTVSAYRKKKMERNWEINTYHIGI